ncbi:MAG: stage sporulation protein [Bacilli bacterium]|nr:stage sporulation protein [Bacilli bacterium]
MKRILNARAILVVTACLLGLAAIFQMWSENNKENAPIAVSAAAAADGVIPADAIRLRIIANSDSPVDQQLKVEVRDQIIQAVGQKLQGQASPDAARQVLQSNLEEFNHIAADVLTSKGSAYPVHTDLGQVPFPTKVYGDQVYPAGNYEALRIVIGAGAGQNWWCVLFPPLCFVDLAHGDASPRDMAEHKTATTTNSSGKTIGHATVDTAAGKVTFALHFALLDQILTFLHRI